MDWPRCASERDDNITVDVHPGPISWPQLSPRPAMSTDNELMLWSTASCSCSCGFGHISLCMVKAGKRIITASEPVSRKLPANHVQSAFWNATLSYPSQKGSSTGGNRRRSLKKPGAAYGRAQQSILHSATGTTMTKVQKTLRHDNSISAVVDDAAKIYGRKAVKLV